MVFNKLQAVLEIDGRRYLLIVDDIDVSFDIRIDSFSLHGRLKNDALELEMRLIDALKAGIRFRGSSDVARAFACLFACMLGVEVRVRVSRLLPSFRIKPSDCGC